MVKNIFWTETAKQDFDSIKDYCSSKEEVNAKTAMIITSVEKLYKFPLNCILLKELPESELYEIKNSNYRIIFQAIEDTVYILSIVVNLSILNN